MTRKERVMKVQDVMTRNVKFCSPETNLAAAAQTMWENDCGILPVLNDEGWLEGTITDRDIAIAVGTRNRLAKDIFVGEVISRDPVVTASPDEDLKSALGIMRNASVRRLPVVNADGSLWGIISMNDIVLRATSRDLEDLVNALKGICEHQATRSATA